VVGEHGVPLQEHWIRISDLYLMDRNTIEKFRFYIKEAKLDQLIGILVTYDLKSEPTNNMKMVPRTNMMLNPWLPIL